MKLISVQGAVSGKSTVSVTNDNGRSRQMPCAHLASMCLDVPEYILFFVSLSVRVTIVAQPESLAKANSAAMDTRDAFIHPAYLLEKIKAAGKNFLRLPQRMSLRCVSFTVGGCDGIGEARCVAQTGTKQQALPG